MTSDTTFNTDADADRFERRVLILTAALWLHLALVALNLLPGWTFALTVPVLFVRWLNTIHEISHLRPPERVGFWVRVFPLLVGPIVGGYRELRVEHLGHHAHSTTPADPTNYLVQKGNLRGVLAALTAPEQLFIRHIAARGIDRALVIEATTRLALFTTAALLAGPAFVAYLVAIRLTWATAFFTFFRALHRRGPEVGLYPFAFPRWAAAAVRAVLGLEVLNAIAHHDRHHARPRIAAKNLHIPLI